MPIDPKLIELIKKYETEKYTPDEIVQGLSQSKNYPDVANKIKAYMGGGYSSDEILGGIKTSPTTKAEPEYTRGQKMYLKAKPYAYPIIEGLGLVGGEAAGIPAGPAGMIAGPALGYGMAKQLERAGETAMGLEQPGTIPQELAGGAARVMEGGTIGMAGPVAGRVVGAIGAPIRKVGQAIRATQGKPGAVGELRPTVIPEAMEAEAAMHAAIGEEAAGLTPAQKTISGITDTFEEISEKAATSRNMWVQFRERQHESLQKFTEWTVDSFWKNVGKRLSPDDAGELLKQVVTKNYDAHAVQSGINYGYVDKLVQGGRVSTQSLKSFAKNILSTNKDVSGIGTSELGDKLLKDTLGLADEINFKSAQEARSRLLRVARSMEYGKDPNIGIAKKLAGLTDKAMEAGANTLKGEAKDAWRAANKFHKEGKQVYENKFITRLVKQLDDNPEVVVDRVFKPRAEKNIRRIKAAAGPLAFGKMRAAFAEQLLTKPQNADGIVLGSTYLKNLARYGDDMLKEVFSPEQIKSLRQVGTLARLLQSPSGGGGGMAIQLTQYGPMVAAANSPLDVGRWARVAPYVIGPRKLARWMLNPEKSQIFIRLLQTKASDPRAMELATRLIGVGVAEHLEEQSQQSLPSQMRPAGQM